MILNILLLFLLSIIGWIGIYSDSHTARLLGGLMLVLATTIFNYNIK